MSALASVGAVFIGASAYQGAFVGALVSMSSTSIVVKCLNDARVQNQPAGQITIATLVLQVRGRAGGCVGRLGGWGGVGG
jgi:Kef-type K+ transport system membrane component KefB